MGFSSPRFSPTPDEILDELLSELSGTELKTLMYVVRRTFGFKKDADHISLSQLLNGIKTKDGKALNRGTGLHKDSVLKATKSLVDNGILVRKQVKSESHGFSASEYSLKMITDPLLDIPTKGVG